MSSGPACKFRRATAAPGGERSPFAAIKQALRPVPAKRAAAGDMKSQSTPSSDPQVHFPSRAASAIA
eukprot:9693384-Alexandrium_andersonii.AAC.1